MRRPYRMWRATIRPMLEGFDAVVPRADDIDGALSYGGALRRVQVPFSSYNAKRFFSKPRISCSEVTWFPGASSANKRNGR